MPNGTAERRIALFLDFENLVTNTGFTASNFDLEPALDRLLEKGKVIFRRAYADWTRFREAKPRLHGLGVELIDVPPSTRAGKNAADMRLVIDALELCYAREHIDTYVIGSGDSDFCPLAAKLRENDRRVIGIAVREATSPLFLKACDEFIYLGSLSRGRGESKEPGEERAKTGGRRERGERHPRPAAAGAKVPDWVRDVVRSLVTGATGPLNPSFIKEALVRKEPDFDERDHRFSTFFRLLEALQAEGLLKLQQIKGRQWYVLAPDSGAPETPSGETPADDAIPEEEEEVIPDPHEETGAA
jgi:uncharacterized LabA/DUF88 family protein